MGFLSSLITSYCTAGKNVQNCIIFEYSLYSTLLYLTYQSCNCIIFLHKCSSNGICNKVSLLYRMTIGSQTHNIYTTKINKVDLSVKRSNTFLFVLQDSLQMFKSRTWWTYIMSKPMLYGHQYCAIKLAHELRTRQNKRIPICNP